jgi:hypothetical protein
MSPARIAACLIALGLLSATILGGRAGAATVLMISVDGLKPEYVTEADQRGLKIPILRGLMADGAYADGVAGVWPTNTYPSHTTLITGVTPAVHGIYNNPEFDPKRKFAESWFWYARQIRVPTLWQAAHRAGLATASIGWPATVGSTDVDFLIPEYWRIFRPTEDLNPSDRYLIAALTRPEGMLERMQQSLGPYLMGNDVSLEADETKTRFAIDPATRAASVNSWLAAPWPASGMAAVMLRDPGDQHILAQVRELLGRISREPAWGIEEILDAEAMQQRGGFPGASFVISMKPGYYTGGNLSGDAVTDFAGHGGHGFAPHHPDMRAALFIAGRGIARHRDLGQIDMRQIAPTVAGLLGVKLASATAAPLLVRQ